MSTSVNKMKDLSENRFRDESLGTSTSYDQMEVECSVAQCFRDFVLDSETVSQLPLLNRARHLEFLKRGLKRLPESYECLDASRPWLCYWILHSLELLDHSLSVEETKRVAQFLLRCQSPNGGFGGAPLQHPHLATTYAAVNALCILGTSEALSVIDRAKLAQFLYNMKTPEGAFRMHEGGEVDIRGVYCAISVAKLTGIYSNQLFENTAEWIACCQTYEGGFACSPGMEAHGGYSFCGLAALVLLGKESLCDIQALLRWTVNRQMKFEGGFQGRTNKLVDGCYSFWQGGVFPLLHSILVKTSSAGLSSSEGWLFNQDVLQEYILMCCQHSQGGLIDKPGKHHDYYHTCYTLSGLSVAQHFASGELGRLNVAGSESNELIPTHPLYNIGIEAVVKATRFFSSS